MKPLYLTSPVRKGLGPCLRPGGETLTRHILGLLRPGPDHTVLDAGCGTGATMGMLREYGAGRLLGLDLDTGLLGEALRCGARIARADLARLPLLSASMDMVLCECVWNLTDKPQVLREFARVLRRGGTLALSDIYLQNPTAGSHAASWPSRSCFFQATDLATVREMVTTAGFEVMTLEDHSRLLKQTAAEFVFAHGSLQGFWQAVLGDRERADAVCAAAIATRPGLFLLTARRSIS
jgi:ubiquinone/menaquinone biosynthesis C-methylase UbiE